MTLDKISPAIQHPKLIVMPFQPEAGWDGIGLGIHFFLGNLVAVHKSLSECWFGWRVKKIFPEPGGLKAYCRGKKMVSHIGELGKKEQVRFWLEGKYQQEDEDILVSMVLHDTPPLHDTQQGISASEISAPGIRLSMGADGLLKGRFAFFDWFSSCKLDFAGKEKAMWPERISARGLDNLGRALETLYLTYIQNKGKIDLAWFYRAVEVSENSYLAQDLLGWGLYKNGEYKMAQTAFLSALELNPAGIGALSGMMWCAVCVNDRERALHYALARAGCRDEGPETARAFVDKKFAEGL